MSRKRTHRCKQFTTEQFIETGAELSNATQSTHFQFKIVNFNLKFKNNCSVNCTSVFQFMGAATESTNFPFSSKLHFSISIEKELKLFLLIVSACYVSRC